MLTEEFRRSSRCDAGQCTEAAYASGAVLVRDSTIPAVQLAVSPADWMQLITQLRHDHGPTGRE